MKAVKKGMTSVLNYMRLFKEFSIAIIGIRRLWLNAIGGDDASYKQAESYRFSSLSVQTNGAWKCSFYIKRQWIAGKSDCNSGINSSFEPGF
jgi:hypothetical protein